MERGYKYILSLIYFARMDFSDIISHWRQSLRWEIQWELHLYQNISTIVCLSRISQGDVNITSCDQQYACDLKVDIIVCKIKSKIYKSCFRNENLNLLVRIDSWIYFYMFLNKNWNIYWSKQSFTSAHREDCKSSTK